MLPPSLLFSAALALTANAFLIPLEVSDKVSTGGGLLPGSEKQTVNLDCRGCPIALEADSSVPQEWKIVDGPHSQPSSRLVLDFAVEGDHVNLNGIPIYPPNPQAVLGLRAKQTTSDESVRAYEQGVPLSTSIEVRPVEAIIGNNAVMKVHPLAIDILGLSDHVVRTDTVRVMIVEGAEGNLMLLPIETEQYRPSPAKDSCTSVLCRVRLMVASKLAAFRAAAAATRFGLFRPGCKLPAGAKPSHGGLHLKGGPNKFAGHLHPHGHAVHAHHHRLRHALHRIIRHVILPIFFGITAGMVVGAFSMLVWTAIASIANRIRGTKPPSYESVSHVEDGTRVSMEGLPKYEEVYTEPEEDVTDEKRQML